MIPLYLVEEAPGLARHAEWMHDRGREGFDARQFREQVGKAAESFRAAFGSAAAAFRGVAGELVRAVGEAGIARV